VAVTCTAATASCPGCGRQSDRVHSRYRRTLADLPVNGRRSVLRLTARRFFCRSPGCDRAVFCERVAGLAGPHARSTARLAGLHHGRGGPAVEGCLPAHPGVEVITRDRWPAYAHAAAVGAPHAAQVADRWHLLRNLRGAVERLFGQHTSALATALGPPPAAP